MVALRRHQLVRLTHAGWAELQGRPWDDDARACLAHWAARCAPLVVTQQRADLAADHLGLGLPAPLRWQRRRIALHVRMDRVLYFDDFPTGQEVVGLLPPATRGAWLALVGALADLGAAPRVYGSFGWQRLTGLNYLHAASDLDLRLTAGDAALADAVTDALSRAGFVAPRLDGEIVFSDGSAVAWREWRLWRARQVDRVLVKRLHGAAMESDAAWLGESQPC